MHGSAQCGSILDWAEVSIIAGYLEGDERSVATNNVLIDAVEVVVVPIEIEVARIRSAAVCTVDLSEHVAIVGMMGEFEGGDVAGVAGYVEEGGGSGDCGYQSRGCED